MSAMFFLRLLSQAATFASLILLAKSLGPEIYGHYAFLLGYLTFFSLLVSFGLNEVVVREIASYPTESDTLLRSALMLKSLLTATAMAIALAIWLLIDQPMELRFWGGLAALSLWTSFAFHSYRTAWEIPFQIDYRMGGPSLILLIVRSLYLLLLALLYGRGITLAWAIGALMLTEIVGSALLLTSAWKQGYPLKPQWDIARMSHLMAQCWPLALSAFFIMIYTRADVLLLQNWRGAEQVGYYSAAMRLIEALAIVPAVFAVAVLPVFSSSFQNDRRQFYRWVSLSFRAMLYVILPIVSVTTFYADEIIQLIYGSTYSPSEKPLGILVWAAISVYCGVVLMNALLASHRQKQGTVLVAIMALCNLVLNAWGIPRFGIVGAAWAAALSYSLALIVAFVSPRMRDLGRHFWKYFPLPLGAALLLAWAARQFHLPLVFACIAEMVGFYLMLILTGQIRREEVRRIWKLFERNTA